MHSSRFRTTTRELDDRYSDNVNILHYALSDESGKATFHFVKNAPAYSGLRKRTYDIRNPQIEEIQVELKQLDDVIPSDYQVDFVKIDVEGAEFHVLNGAIKTLSRARPTIIFECGLGASDHYDASPESIFDLLTKDIGLKVSTLQSFLGNDASLTKEKFSQLFHSNEEYYFIAHP